MKWVTRERAKVDRISCPWLNKNLVDKEAAFIFVPAERVLEAAKAVGVFKVARDLARISRSDQETLGRALVAFDSLCAQLTSKAVEPGGLI